MPSPPVLARETEGVVVSWYYTLIADSSRYFELYAGKVGSREIQSEPLSADIMDENTHDDRQTVYEIGYLITDKVPEDKVPAEADAVRKVVTDAGAAILAEEMPHRQSLAYTIRAKTLAGSYDKHTQAYFGWIKFEVGSSKIQGLKKAIETRPSVLRMLLITTIRENTYLGKHAPAMATVFGAKKEVVQDEPEIKKEMPPASLEEMDKSIDAMVKEGV